MSEPRWVRAVALGCALALASFGAVGLLLADLGLYRPLVVLVLGAIVLGALYRWARPILDIEGELSPAARICAPLAVALSVISAAWNGSNASQHVQINRDGGLYLNAGKWIATHGTLELQPYVGPFAHNAALVAESTGMKQKGFHLEFDLSHMLSAFLAEAQNVGGNHLMFLAVPILSGVALLAFYLLSTRLLQHPVAALGATATLALLMPQISFSRDSTTEIPIQVLLFTALWLLCDRRTLRTPGPAFTAGLLLGLVQAMHVDGLAFLVGLPAVYGLSWLHTNRAGRPQLKRGLAWSALGVVVGMLFGAYDLFRWDRYYLSVVSKNVEKLAVVEVLAILAAVAFVVLIRRGNLFERLQSARPRVANAAGVVVLIGGFGAWFIRPLVQHVHAGVNAQIEFVQRLNGLPIDGTKRYAELSVRWISWYAGPITLTLGIVGAAALAVLLVRGSMRLPIQIATLMFAPPALLYIWRPTITPDHIWAARRFLPAVFPGLILLTFAVICVLARGTDPKWSGQRRSLAVVLAIAAVVYPGYTIRNVSKMTEQRGLFPVIENTCKRIGPNAAVVMLEEPRVSVAYLSDPQTLRSFCNVPVVVMPAPAKARVLHTLAAEWQTEGRTLYVVAEFPQTITQLFPNAKQMGSRRFNNHFLEETLTRRPSHYVRETLQLQEARVPAPPTPGSR